MCDFEDPPQYIALAQLRYALSKYYPNIQNKELLMDRLVKRGLDVNYALPPDAAVAQHSPELVGSTALHFAVKAQDLKVISYILQRGAKVTATDNHAFSPLRLAIGRGLRRKGILKDQVVESLLKAQHDQNDTSNPSCKLGLSHLHIACMANDARMVEFLLRSGAPVDAAISAASPHLAGFRPVHVAARYCAEESLKLLVSRGADAGAREARGLTSLQLLMKYNQQLMDLPRGRRSEHNLAYERMMKWMLLNCAVGPLQDGHGLQRLHVAASMMDSAILVDMLNENPEIDVNAPLSENSPYWPGYTPLHFAARCGFNAVRILVQRGASLAKPNASRIAPFDLCLDRYKPEIISKIMSLDETLKSITFTSSPLVTVCEALRNFDDLKGFVKRMRNVDDPVSLNSPLWPGYTLLHLAVTLMHPETFGYWKKLSYEFDLEERYPKNRNHMLLNLMRLEANPVAQDVRNFTPVHLAFRQHKPATLDHLLNIFHFSSKAKGYGNPTDLDGLSLLHISSVVGNHEVVEAILKNNVDVDVRTRSGLTFFSGALQELYYVSLGSTPLHYAVTSDSTVINYLIELGADPLAVNSDGHTPLLLAFMGMSNMNFGRSHIKKLLWTPSVLKFDSVHDFHVACWSDSVPAVISFLDRVDVNEKINCVSINNLAKCPRALRPFIETQTLTDHVGYTPLHFAVKYQSLDVIKLLVERGADLQIRDARGMSPLHLALAISHPSEAKEVLKSLMTRDNNDLSTNVPERGPVDDYGVTALHIACRMLDLEWVKRLLATGSDVNAQIAMHSPVRPGDTPLLHALREGQLVKMTAKNTKIAAAIAKLLIAQGADVAIPNADNVTPLHAVVDEYTKDKEPDLSSIYLETKLKSCNVNRVNKEGLSFLHIAVMNDNMEMVSDLCTRGVDVNRPVDYFAQYQGGYGPLHFAVILKNPEIMHFLIEKGAKVSAEDRRGCTPLHAFCECNEYCKEDLILKLCEYGADADAQDVCGRTPLELLLQERQNRYEENRVISLISCGARLNNVNPQSGISLLFTALSERKRYLPDILSNANVLADVLTVMDDGSTALHNIVRSDKRIRVDGEHMEHYLCVIEELLMRGCYINARDNRGRTALHVAVEYDNHTGVYNLLAAGINVNIADNAGNVPLSLSSMVESIDGRIHLALLMYLHRLMLLGLEVSEPNRRLYEAAREEGFPRSDANYLLLRLLFEIGALVGSKLHENFSLREVMTERAISEYPTMPRARRVAVVQKLASSELYEAFPILRSPIRYQYRRILERIDLHESAKSALDFIFIMGINSAVPELCIEKILSFLNNEDLKTVIAVRKTAKRRAGNGECSKKKVKSESP